MVCCVQYLHDASRWYHAGWYNECEWMGWNCGWWWWVSCSTNISEGAELWLMVWRLCNLLIEKNCDHLKKPCKTEEPIKNLCPLYSRCWLLLLVWRDGAICFNFNQGAEMWLVAWMMCNFLIQKWWSAKKQLKKWTNQKLTSSLPPQMSDDVGMGRRWEAVQTALGGLSCGRSHGGR